MKFMCSSSSSEDRECCGRNWLKSCSFPFNLSFPSQIYIFLSSSEGSLLLVNPEVVSQILPGKIMYCKFYMLTPQVPS